MTQVLGPGSKLNRPRSTRAGTSCLAEQVSGQSAPMGALGTQTCPGAAAVPCLIEVVCVSFTACTLHPGLHHEGAPRHPLKGCLGNASIWIAARFFPLQGKFHWGMPGMKGKTQSAAFRRSLWCGSSCRTWYLPQTPPPARAGAGRI